MKKKEEKSFFGFWTKIFFWSEQKIFIFLFLEKLEIFFEFPEFFHFQEKKE